MSARNRRVRPTFRRNELDTKVSTVWRWNDQMKDAECVEVWWRLPLCRIWKREASR